jgi:large subunit ribosomal protein L3
MKGILGKKIGMTQVFTKSGKLIPVTVIEVEPNVVTQIKTVEKDGYDAIQLGTCTVKEKNSNKAKIGHAKKANTAPKRFLKELRGVNVNDYQLGQTINIDIFQVGEMVDVSGTSKGKGYQGVIKRWNQSRGPMGHGSQYHRGVGSLGTLLPMHVLKGKKMAGHMGSENITIQNLEIVSVDLENNVILVKGNVPGPKKSLVFIKTAVKNADKVNETEELVAYEKMTAEELKAEVQAEIEEANEELAKEEAEKEAEEKKKEAAKKAAQAEAKKEAEKESKDSGK